jgi:Fibronectin type III domain
MAYIDGFFNDLGGSQWARSLSQYCSGIAINQSSCASGATFIQDPVGQFQSAIIDTTPVPAAPTQADIGNRAAAAAAHYNYPSGSLYMVYTPSGKSQLGFGTDWCAYHTWVQAGSVNVPYGYMPYQPDAGSNCGASLVDGPLDGFSIVGGHEYAEAVTDPLLADTAGYSGWLDPTIANFSGEIGDKCDWNPPVKNVTMNGRVWPVQGLFSNQALAQGLSPCVFSAPTTVPGRPTAVKAVAGIGQAIVAWAAPTADGGSPILSYTVHCSPACIPLMVSASSLQTVVTGLPGDTPISFTVTAVNEVGAGAPSNPSIPISFRGAATQSVGAPAPSKVPSPAVDSSVDRRSKDLPPATQLLNAKSTGTRVSRFTSRRKMSGRP